jgi:hypothetical protein
MNRRDFLRSLSLVAGGTVAATLPVIAVARMGRPASPRSVAGVHRRRRRRHRRRVRRYMRLHSLPYGCTTIVQRHGNRYYYCGGIWYRPAYEGTTIVYIVDDIESGANTDLEFGY